MLLKGKEASPKHEGIFGFLNKIESDLTKWFVGTICTMLCLSIPFYFNTTSTIQAHDQKIVNIISEVKGLEKTVTVLGENPAFNSEQITAIKKIVEEIQLRQQRLEIRQDKMYDLMLETLKSKK